ncbi:ATPase domain-containing protein [Geminicoccus harenae]|uniref:ATPase domain-containing protein n=1 Tax=Geminicoccus harenae TaxID=2498453 RepID=UPI00168B84AB|nr:ATPase domain-containing protein [Geminicoccus harenae]
MTDAAKRIPFGNDGLDAVLGGGLTPGRVYLLEGTPGSGKTTLAMQFLMAGVRRGESTLYVTLSETIQELTAVAESHGWDLSGIQLFDLSLAEQVLGRGREQSVLHPWEVELGETIDLIIEQVERSSPKRVVFDSLSEMRLLAHDPLRFRRQLLALKQYFAGRGITVLFVDDLAGSAGREDKQLHSLCHGVITLERLTLEFGAARRRLQVQKMRGIDFVAGYHDLVIRTGGIEVFPRLIALRHHLPFVGEPVGSGVPELDRLLGGGPLRGTSTLITGPAGVGKTTITLQYIMAACRRGERCVIYEFDERVGTMIVRARAMGLDLHEQMEAGRLMIRQVDPAELSPGEFSAIVRRDVELQECRMVVIDSLSGYLSAMPQEQQLILQIHELLSYLNQRGVVTFLLNPQAGLMGTTSTGGLNVSHIADAVILLRFFEAGGRIRKAVSVIKNRGGSHEDAIRELRIDAQGLRVGTPLTEFRGVLSGTPEYVGAGDPLMQDRDSGG